MKTKSLIVLIGLIVLLVIGGVFWLIIYLDNGINIGLPVRMLQYCEQDDDCVRVSDGCGCGGGGQDTTINKESLDYWNDNSKRVICPAVMSGHWTCSAEPKCIDNVCKLVETCGKEGEKFYPFETGRSPVVCCEGLTEWLAGFDTREIVNGKCVETGLVAGAPYGICINCGNGICEDIENICNCPKDCDEIVLDGKIRMCPEWWYINDMPCGCFSEDCSECDESEYLIINDEKKYPSEVDIDWIKENCKVNEPEIVV